MANTITLKGRTLEILSNTFAIFECSMGVCVVSWGKYPKKYSKYLLEKEHGWKIVVYIDFKNRLQGRQTFMYYQQTRKQWLLIEERWERPLDALPIFSALFTDVVLDLEAVVHNQLKEEGWVFPS